MYKPGFLFFLFFASCAFGQLQPGEVRTIEVTGTAELIVDPDEILFHIAIEEYWQEEFEGKKWEDYRNKVDIQSIEKELIDELTSLNIKMEDITLLNTGNYWRQRGKDFLVRKILQINLTEFAKANELSNNLETRGIQSMYVQQLKHAELESLKLDCKAKALANARKKAERILDSVGESPGKALRIVEMDQNQAIFQKDYAMMRSASASEQGEVQYENFRKISVKADVRVLFSIN